MSRKFNVAPEGVGEQRRLVYYAPSSRKSPTISTLASKSLLHVEKGDVQGMVIGLVTGDEVNFKHQSFLNCYTG